MDKAQLLPLMLISSIITSWIAFPFSYVSFFPAPTPSCLESLPKVNSLSANLFSAFWEFQDKLTCKQVIAVQCHHCVKHQDHEKHGILSKKLHLNLSLRVSRSKADRQGR